MTHRKGHIVLCGLDGLGLRTLSELRNLGEEVTVVADDASIAFIERAEALGGEFIRGNYRDEATLKTACVADARALVITAADDVGNIHAALAAQELNPNIRIVLRIFNQEFGQRLASLFADCEVLSSSAIAAPAFVSAALRQDWQQEIAVGGHTLRVRAARPGDPGTIMPIARVTQNQGVELFPREINEELLCLVEAGPEHVASRSGRRKSSRWAAMMSYLRALAGNIDRRLSYALVFLFALGFISMLIFFVTNNLDLADAFYNTTTIIISGGLGDLNPLTAPLPLKLFGTFLMIIGATTLTVFYALVTDAVVSVRLDRALGRANVDLRDHVIVCGLGNIGYRVVTQLHALGLPVAATEKNETHTGIADARRMGVPVLLADARAPDTLRALNIDKARSIVVATDDDAANLETALNARAFNPGIRVVLRLFDFDLAARVERAFNIHISRSVSALAAPRFAAAAIAGRVAATIPVGPRVLIVAQTTVEPSSQAVGQTVAALESAFEGRVLMLDRNGTQTWQPPAATVLSTGDDLAIVSTRKGLVTALGSTAKT
ncbi:MAG: NAD-binding protein [Chloroflexia bacterium]